MVLVFFFLLAVLAFAILAEMDSGGAPRPAETGACPGCARTVEEDWLLCPRCRTLLTCACSGCGRRVDRWRPYCPWCGSRHGEAG